MDLATLMGILAGVGLVGWAIASGGNMSSFVSLKAVLIVFGGTLGAVLINYPLQRVLRVGAVLRQAFITDTPSPGETIKQMVDFARSARREGLLALEDQLGGVEDDFLRKGIQLVVDGTEPDLVRTVLHTEMDAIGERHRKGQKLFETMGALAPAFGMIGTLVGLIQMLQSLDNPDAIGPGMATALLTTFYGVLLANLFFIPMAGKLRTRSSEEQMARRIVLEGVLAIQAGDNPRVVREKLIAHLSERQRRAIEDEEDEEPADDAGAEEPADEDELSEGVSAAE